MDAEADHVTTAQRIETLHNETETLVLQRQALHERQASRAELEHNRLRIVSAQQELSRAYIEWATLRVGCPFEAPPQEPTSLRF
jgi:hypothetical protein